MKKIVYIALAAILLGSCQPAKEETLKTAQPAMEEASETEKQASEETTTENELSEDKIQSLKVAYFTKELNLSSSEAETFWPIYNKHNEIYKTLSDTEWEAIKDGLKNVSTYSDEEAEKLLVRYKSYLHQRLENRLRFIDELETVISPKKIMQLKHAEYNFNKKLLKQYRSGEATTK